VESVLYGCTDGGEVRRAVDGGGPKAACTPGCRGTGAFVQASKVKALVKAIGSIGGKP